MPLAAAPARKFLRVVMVASRYSEAGRFLVDRSVACRSVLGFFAGTLPRLGRKSNRPSRDLDMSLHFVGRTSGPVSKLIFRGRPAGFAGRRSVALAKNGIVDDAITAVGIVQQP